MTAAGDCLTAIKFNCWWFLSFADRGGFSLGIKDFQAKYESSLFNLALLVNKYYTFIELTDSAILWQNPY